MSESVCLLSVQSQQQAHDVIPPVIVHCRHHCRLRRTAAESHAVSAASFLPRAALQSAVMLYSNIVRLSNCDVGEPL